MYKFIIISDSFKGTITSKEINEIFNTSLKKVFKNRAKAIPFEIADGGEGTSEIISHYLDSKKITVQTKDANFNDIEASYYISNKSAYIDVSSCAYLPTTKIKDAKITSSFGVGLLIKDAINLGAKEIYIGLGGSATNDFGLGMLCALGAKFYDLNNNPFIPTGNTICNIDHFDLSLFKETVKHIKFYGLHDVKNPLCGENGATFIFGKQKGLDEESIKKIDNDILLFTQKLHDLDYKNINNIKGAGAAGGIGGAILEFFNGKLLEGADYILNLIHFNDELKDTDVVFTGEGNLDNQSSCGKVVDKISSRCKKYKVPVVAIVGGENLSDDNHLTNDLTAVITTTRKPMEFKDLKPYSKEFYKKTIENVLKLIKLGIKIKG